MNINHERSLEIFVHKEKLLGSAREHALVPVIFSIQEAKSWDVPNLELPGYVCCGGKFGFATLLVSGQYCTIKRSWRLEERCTAVLFGTTLVMGKSTEMYEDLSRVSLECCGKDIVVEPETSALQEILMWNWV